MALASPGEKTIEVSYPVVEGTVVCGAQEATKRTYETGEKDTVVAFEQRQAATSGGAYTSKISTILQHSQEAVGANQTPGETETLSALSTQPTIPTATACNGKIDADADSPGVVAATGHPTMAISVVYRDQCYHEGGSDRQLLRHATEYATRSVIYIHDGMVVPSYLWKGGAVKRQADIPAVVRWAKRVGLDAVFMALLKCSLSQAVTSFDVEIYVIDAVAGELYHRKVDIQQSSKNSRRVIDDYLAASPSSVE